MLAPLRFVALEQFAWLGVKHVTQRVERAEVDALHRAGDKPLRGRDRDRTAAGLGERVGALNAASLHEFGQAKSHVQHASNVCTEAGRCNSLYMSSRTLERVPRSRYI